LAFFFQAKYFASVRQARASSRHHSFEKEALLTLFQRKIFLYTVNAFVLFVKKVLEKAKGEWQTKEIMI
jgi:hypothetical protein